MTPLLLRAVVGGVLLTTIVGGSLTVKSCMKASTNSAVAAAKVDTALAGARAESGREAVNIGITAATAEAAIEKITKENDDAIHSALGANVAVDPAVDAAGRRSLCRRSAYRNSEQCKRLLGTGAGPVAGTR